MPVDPRIRLRPCWRCAENCARCFVARCFTAGDWRKVANDSCRGMRRKAKGADALERTDVLGKRIITTRWQHSVTIRLENATAALEVMSRFAADPKWLIYLPPTMSPSATTNQPGLLEHPAEAFGYFRSQGVPQVICEEKHMGSRAVVIVCRDEDAARRRFGVTEGDVGIVYTRTGRRFFNAAELERQFLDRIRAALTASGFWDDFRTTWGCLDCELLPWSAKAQELLRSQYAAVGAAGLHICRGCATGAWVPSDRWPCASLRWASKRWTASCATSRCGACTNAFSACWRWKANPWIHDCKCGGRRRASDRPIQPRLRSEGCKSPLRSSLTCEGEEFALVEFHEFGVKSRSVQKWHAACSFFAFPWKSKTRGAGLRESCTWDSPNTNENGTSSAPLNRPASRRQSPGGPSSCRSTMLPGCTTTSGWKWTAS